MIPIALITVFALAFIVAMALSGERESPAGALPSPRLSDDDASGILVGAWDLEAYGCRRIQELKERWDAWWFYRWANAIYLQALEDNPPAAHHHITAGRDGRWRVYEYDGAREDEWLYEMVGHCGPPDKPNGSHHWRVIGEAEGFLYREEAERYLAAHARDRAIKSLAYSATGELQAASPPPENSPDDGPLGPHALGTGEPQNPSSTDQGEG